ncbi:zinc metalloprotease HtpX [Gaopeijia maritima]|uniref:zinc metalloprotease HtpX n=1 Tax=Gaopeijia maritima TaxID=3119007 RepID=UPI00328F33B4
MQTMKVFGLMTVLTLLLVAGGSYFGGSSGAILMFGVAAVMNVGSYWFSDKVVLRMYRARVLERGDAPELYTMVERLAERAGLPMPTVAISPQPQPNAFATGRSPERGVVCFTQGILQALPMDELEGVTAHELAHIKHRHMLVGTVAATMAGALMMLSRVAAFGAMFGGRGGDRDNGIGGLVMMIVAPLAALFIQMAISRQNEFQADRTAAEIVGSPRGLAGALRRLDNYARQIPMDVNPAAAQLAIVNPLSGRRGGVLSLLSTHPPMDERIARLLALEAGS